MATKNKPRNQPSPAPTLVAGPDTDGQAQEQTNIVTLTLDVPAPATIDTFRASNEASMLASRLHAEALSTARTLLREAFELYRSGDKKPDLIEKADGIASSAALRLYRSLVDGTVSRDEVSGLLGEVYGFTPKGDGTPGKTPAREGADIRKRIFRAEAAFDYATNGKVIPFFDGLPEPEVQLVVERLERRVQYEALASEIDRALGADEPEDVTERQETAAELLAGSVTLWTAYDLMSKMKLDGRTKVEPAFDPKKVSDMADALLEAGSGDKVRNSPALIASYIKLTAAIDLIRHVPATPTPADAS